VIRLLFLNTRSYKEINKTNFFCNIPEAVSYDIIRHTAMTLTGTRTAKQRTRVMVIVFNATFNNSSAIYIMTASFIGEGNRGFWRKSSTCRMSRTNFIT
jgi:hypothetical protein